MNSTNHKGDDAYPSWPSGPLPEVFASTRSGPSAGDEATRAEPDATTLKASPADVEATASFPDLARLFPPVEGPSTRTSGDRDAPEISGRRVGEYVLVERLGGGSQGEVWRAIRWHPYYRVVALKVVWPGMSLNEERVDRLRKEAERGGKLLHPALLPILDFDRACDGLAFIAMPLVEGFTLAQVLAHRRGFRAGSPPADLHRLAILADPEYFVEVARLLSRVARGLQVSHDSKIVHRDVKPSNILLDRSEAGGIFLADFGLALDLDDLTEVPDSAVPGTLPYLPPEKLLGRGPRDEVLGDVFALGVTIFEAAALERPVPIPKGLFRSQAASHLASAEPRRPRSLEPRLPRDLEAIILKAIDRNPSIRYRSAADLADDLDRFASGEPVLARPAGPVRRAFRRARTYRRSLAATSALLFVGLCLSATLAVVRSVSALRGASARAEAEALLKENRIEEAYEAVLRAREHDPDHPATQAIIARVSRAMLDLYKDSTSFENVLPASRIDRRWRALANRSDPERERLILSGGLVDISIRSDRPGTHLTLHAIRADGTPVDGEPLHAISIGPDVTDLQEIVPGAYWLTATTPTGAFVEQIHFLPRGFLDVRTASKLELRPRTFAETSQGMASIPAGKVVLPDQFVRAEGIVFGEDVAVAHGSARGIEARVAPFWIDRREVTNREFVTFLDATNRIKLGKAIWGERGRPEPDRLDWPVTGITYEEASAFAAWRGCRLPSEEELEQATISSIAPAGSVGPVMDGLHGVESDMMDAVNQGGNRIFGLRGNAAELTLFRYRPGPGSRHPTIDWSCFVVRSGIVQSFGERILRLDRSKKTVQGPGSRNPTVGFRCARSVTPAINQRRPSSE